MKVKRIIVGVDGSENAMAATTFAATMARATGAPVVAVHAQGLLDRLTRGNDPVPTQSHRDEIAECFEEVWCIPLAGLDVEHRLLDGAPVSVLLRVANRPGDVIVLGSRGAGGFEGLSLGSTSSQVVQHSTVPVVIVPNRQPAEE